MCLFPAHRTATEKPCYGGAFRLFYVPVSEPLVTLPEKHPYRGFFWNRSARAEIIPERLVAYRFPGG
jgi:hypothetical protein